MCELANAAQADHFVLATCEAGKWVATWWDDLDRNIDHLCTVHASHSPQMGGMMAEGVKTFVKSGLAKVPFDRQFTTTRWPALRSLVD